MLVKIKDRTQVPTSPKHPTQQIQWQCIGPVIRYYRRSSGNVLDL